jgi:hypothetical protein
VSLQISDAVIWQESGEGVSLYHADTGDFITLNETGAKIWMLVESDGEREKIISKLSLAYAGTSVAVSGRIRMDVEEFIASMIKGGLLAENGPE